MSHDKALYKSTGALLYFTAIVVSDEMVHIRFTGSRIVWIVLVAIFTVMCYNVLCDKYATRQLYGYCPSWALNWQHRRRHIFEEIHHYGADVINLQVSRFGPGNNLTYLYLLITVKSVKECHNPT